MATLLLDRGADAGAKDNNDWTALLLAAEKGHTATATLLLDRGADVGATSNDGRTALTVAAQQGHTHTAALLAFFRANASDDHQLQHPLLAALHGWCRLRIAAAFRLDGLAQRLSRSPVTHPRRPQVRS